MSDWNLKNLIDRIFSGTIFSDPAEDSTEKLSSEDSTEKLPAEDSEEKLSSEDNIEKVIDGILVKEGGFQISPKDKGNYNSKGELVGTNFGISAPVYEEYIGRVPSVYDMKNITVEKAKDIYRKNYITPVTKNLGIAEDSPVFEQVVDMVVNHGYKNTVPIIQRALDGIKVDGMSGKRTRGAISKAIKNDPVGFNNMLVNKRIDFYKDIVKRIPDQQKFISGWINRAISFIK
jgi:lysozyme family protein